VFTSLPTTLVRYRWWRDDDFFLNEGIVAWLTLEINNEKEQVTEALFG
jgi:hypothetical protein